MRPGPAPVLETRMRVSGGDIVATTWAAQSDGSSGPAVVVELTNEASVPVAVAVTVRASAGGRIRRVAVDGRRLMVDGFPSVVLDRDPGRFSLVDSGRDLWEEVTSGLAVKEAPAPVRCRIGAAAGALIVPLPHRTTLRFAVPADDLVDNPSTSLPPMDRVVAGWSSRLDAAAAVDLPDGVDVHRALVDLLLADSSSAVVVELTRWGFGDEAAHRLGKSWLGSGIERLEAAAALWTLARDVNHFDGSSASSQGVPLEEVIRAGGDGMEGRRAVASLAGLFEAMGDTRAAADALLLGGGISRSGEPALSVAALGPAAELRALADRLVRRSVDGLDLLVDVPDGWFGQPIEVHGLVTSVGRLGFAIRWHGTRPALLWQLEPHPGEGQVVLRVPGLDSAFSSSELAGEALLAAPAGRLLKP